MKIKHFVSLVFCFVIMLVSVTAFADLVEPSPEEWGAILVQITSGELSILAAVAAAIQALMLVLRTKLGEHAGRMRLVLVSLLSVLGGVLVLKTKGMEWGSALVHSSVLAAAQVFMYDLFKYLKPDQVVASTTKRSKKK
jgi:hypothetical protein